MKADLRQENREKDGSANELEYEYWNGIVWRRLIAWLFPLPLNVHERMKYVGPAFQGNDLEEDEEAASEVVE